MKKIIVLGILILFLMSIPVASGASNQGYLNSRNSGLSLYSGLAITGQYEWSFNSGHYLAEGSPAINSTFYAFIATADGHVFCISPNGNLVWEYDTGTSYDIQCQVVIDEARDAVFFARDTHVGVNCLYMNNGTLKWKVGIDTYSYYTDMTTRDDLDYLWITKNPGILYKVWKDNGTMSYIGIGGFGSFKPIINPSDDSVIVQYTTGSGSVYCYSSIGVPLWTKNPISPNSTSFGNMALSTAFSDNSIYAFEHGIPNKIYRFHSNNGTMMSTKIVSYLIAPGASPVLGYGGTGMFQLYVSAMGGNIYGYNADLTGEHHIITLGGNITGMSECESGIIYAYNEDHRLYAIDVYPDAYYGRTVSKKWDIDLGMFIGRGCPVLAETNILYAFGDYKLYKIMQSTPYGITLSISGYGTPNNPYVDLTWTYPYSNGTGGDVLSYVVYRSFDAITYYNITWMDNSTRTYTDNTILAGTIYYYYVLGHNSVGDGTHSNVVSINITALLPTVTTETGIIGQMLPFIIVLFMSLFMSIIYQKRFSMSMFLICLGMMMSVMIWLGALPVFGVGIIVLLYSSVIWMAYSQSGGANE